MNRFSKRVFLDYAATTPMDSRVFRAMKPFFSKKFANPLAFHQEGLMAGEALEASRKIVAKITGTKPDEVIFTGSGTESDNMALRGVIAGIQNDESKLFEDWRNVSPEIVTTHIEHPAIVETCRHLEKEGDAKIVFLETLENGGIDTSQLQNFLTEKTLVVSVMLVNNEIGTILPVRDVARELKKFKNKIGRRHDEAPYLHTDASQAPCYLDINLDRLGVDMMTLDGSKIYGPKGVGCLIKKSYVPMSPVMFGGNQEMGLRAGTQNVAGIVGFAKALEIAAEMRDTENARLEKLQKYFVQQIEAKIPEAILNGGLKNRVSNNVNICIPGLNAEFAVIQLDEKGIACSAMTACKSTSDEARSYVVDSLNKDGRKCGASSLRFSMGRETRKGDIDIAVSVLAGIK